MNMNSLLNFYSVLRKNIFFIFAACVLCVNLCIIFYGFAQKDQYHIDEQWSYAHSNSNGKPYIANDQVSRRWLDPQIYHNYLTVQTSDEFNYSHIYENLRRDKHTPLYFMTLYTISYFFADTFNQWIGGGLNIFLWLLTLAAMYRLSQKFFDERWLIIAPLIFYAFSTIGLSTVLYIRVYLMQTLFATCLINQMLSFVEKQDDKYRFNAFGIFIFSLLGMLTSYNSIMISFFLSVVFGSYLLFKKEYKKILYLALAMIGSVIFFICIFPYALTALISFNPQVHNSGKDLFVILTDMLSIYWSELFNTNINIYSNSIYTYVGTILILYFITIYAYCVDFSFSKKIGLLLLTIFLVSAYLSYTIPEMYEYKSRYKMFLYPTLSVISIYMLYKIFNRFLSLRKAAWGIYVLIAINILNVNYQRYCAFWMHHSPESVAIISDFKGKNLMIAPSNYWMVEDVSYLNMSAQKIYIVSQSLYNYLMRCDTEKRKTDFHNPQELIPQFYKDLNGGDYLLIFNRYKSQLKYDKEMILTERGSLCEDLNNRLRFLKTIKIGVLYYDVYQIIQTDENMF